MKMRAEPKRSVASLRPRRARLQKPIPAVGWKVSGSGHALRCKHLEKMWGKYYCAFLF